MKQRGRLPPLPTSALVGTLPGWCEATLMRHWFPTQIGEMPDDAVHYVEARVEITADGALMPRLLTPCPIPAPCSTPYAIRRW